MYCAWRIPAHLRCTQCSILLHLMDICFLTCICLWQISQIQTFLFRVVGPGLVSTSPAFVSNSANHPTGLHGRHAQNGKSGLHWGRGVSTQFAQQFEFAVTAPPLVGCVVWSLPSVVLFFIPVPAFLVGMVLSGSPVAACFRSEITRFDTCKSAAIWAIETPLLT